MNREVAIAWFHRLIRPKLPCIMLGVACVVLLAKLVISRHGDLAWDDADYLRRALSDARFAASGNPLLLLPRMFDRFLLEQPKPPFLIAWIELFVIVLSRPRIETLLVLSSVVPFALLMAAASVIARKFHTGLAGFFALLLIAASPSSLLFGGKVMVETFLGLWILLTLFFASRVVASPCRRHGVALGVSVGFALLTKFTPVVLLAGALSLFCLRVFRNDEGRRQRVRSASVALAVCLLVAGPWYARNLISTVRFATFSSQYNLAAEDNKRILGPSARLLQTASDLPGWPVAIVIAGRALLPLVRGSRPREYPSEPAATSRSALTAFQTLTWATAASSAVILLFPPYFDTRFLLPLWPALAVIIGIDAARVFPSLSQTRRLAMAAGLATGLATSVNQVLREPVSRTSWVAVGLIEELVSRYQVATLANLGNFEDWNVCKTGLINELRDNPSSCFVLHDLSRDTPEKIAKRLPRFDAVIMLDESALPVTFLDHAPGLNRGYRKTDAKMLEEAGLVRVLDLPTADLPPLKIFVRQDATAKLSRSLPHTSGVGNPTSIVR